MNKLLKHVDLLSIYRKYTLCAGPFRCFIRSTPFVSLKHYPNFELTSFSKKAFDISEIAFEPSIDRLAKELSQIPLHETLFLIDLEGSEALDLSFLLYKEYGVVPVPNFNGIMHPNGLVGDIGFISRLVEHCEMLDITKEPVSYSIVLDHSRYGDFDDEILKSRFNNQYELGDSDLPSYEMLTELGYKRLFCIMNNKIKEDVKAYSEYLVKKNFPISILNNGVDNQHE